MEAAPDLRDVVVESFAAYSAGDLTFLESHISRQPGTHALGADPSEWWPDAAAILKSAEAEVSDGIRFVPDDIQAWREGSVGWVVAPDARFQLPDGREGPLRYTGVYHLEEGAWRLVQGHWSIGVSNDVAFDRAL
jgi:hypothetical protein